MKLVIHKGVAANMKVLKQCLLLLMVYSQLVVLNGQPSDGHEEYRRGRTVEREDVISSRLMQQLERMMSIFNERFDGLEHRMNNIASAIDVARNISLTEMDRQTLTSQDNHLAQMDKIENLASVFQATNEEMKQVCVNNVSTQFLAFSRELSNTSLRRCDHCNGVTQNFTDLTNVITVCAEQFQKKQVNDSIGNLSSSFSDELHRNQPTNAILFVFISN